MRVISYQIKSISKAIEIIQKNQIEIWELKSIIVEIFKSPNRSSTTNLIMQKKGSANMNTDQLRHPVCKTDKRRKMNRSSETHGSS